MARRILAGVAVAAMIFAGVAAQDVPVRYIPADLQNTPWLQRLAAAQTRAAAKK